MKEKMELDKYEIGIIINALNSFRNAKINEGLDENSLTSVNDLLLKLIDFYDKKQVCKIYKER